MPVAVAPLVGIALGVLFAWAGMEELARVGGSSGSRSLVVASLFGVTVVLLFALSAMVAFPALTSQ